MNAPPMEKLRALATRPRMRRYLGIVVGPTLLVLAYLGLIASEGYVSRAQVLVEHENNAALAAAELTLGALSLGGQSSKLDALVVETFMQSRTMLEYLDRELDLRGHFSSPDVDLLSRLPDDASGEEFLEYYRDHLTTYVDEETYVVEVEFVAHDPAFAQQVVEKLVRRAEFFVNDVSQQLAREQLAFVNGEVEKANDRFKKASREMIGLQREYDIFSPEKETEATGTILSALMQELSKQRIEHKALSAYLTPQAAEVRAARARIKALEDQIEQERRTLVGGDGSGLNDTLLAYQDAQLNLTLAGEIYKTALATLESTRLDAARKVKHLVSLSAPSLPDADERPRVAYWTLTAFVLLNLVYFVVGLIVATIEDHRE